MSEKVARPKKNHIYKIIKHNFPGYFLSTKKTRISLMTYERI